MKTPKSNPKETNMNVWSTNISQIPYKMRGWSAQNIANNTVQNLENAMHNDRF
jgi:hypothetical protein